MNRRELGRRPLALASILAIVFFALVVCVPTMR
jgi:hypothetical protein